MTELLMEAFKKAASLPEDLQDQLARMILEAMAEDEKWIRTFEDSQDKLDQLAQKAEESYCAGETREIECDELEMKEIGDDKELNESLRRGLKDATLRKGRFVE